MATRSPIRLVTRRVHFKSGVMPVRSWKCDEDRLAVAELQNRRDPRLTVIIHRSTKPRIVGGAGPHWQASKFESSVPTGDMQGASCTLLLREFGHKQWRLTKVVAR